MQACLECPGLSCHLVRQATQSDTTLEECKSLKCTTEIVALHPKRLPARLEDLEDWLCSKCDTYACYCCAKVLPASRFPTSMWSHRLEAGRRTYCDDCARPPCTSPHCTTCAVCRHEDCKRNQCTERVEPLNARQLPKTIEELRSFKCARCRYPPCRVCGKPMPTGGTRKRFQDSKKAEWLCGECQTLEESRETLRKYGGKSK